MGMLTVKNSTKKISSMKILNAKLGIVKILTRRILTEKITENPLESILVAEKDTENILVAERVTENTLDAEKVTESTLVVENKATVKSLDILQKPKPGLKKSMKMSLVAPEDIRNQILNQMQRNSTVWKPLMKTNDLVQASLCHSSLVLFF